jgi:hypothetical protein
MQTLTLSSNARDGRLPDSKTSKRRRAFHFLSKRYAQRERPGIVAEFFLFGLLVLTAAWSMFTLAHALGLNR